MERYAHPFGTTELSNCSELTEFTCTICDKLGKGKKAIKKSHKKVTWTTPGRKVHAICLGCHGTIISLNRTTVWQGKFVEAARTLF